MAKKRAAKQSHQPVEDPGADFSEIDAYIAALDAKEAAKRAVQETAVTWPPARLNASVTPISPHELVLFGGELFNGQVTHFFNDLYVFDTATKAWRKYTSANAPHPRSSHQAVAIRIGGEMFVYIFGGEFAKEDESAFHHFHDVWRLSTRSFTWEQISIKGSGPLARSGHRMIAHGTNLLVFGGFIDTGRVVKYLGDMWVLDTAVGKWKEHKIGAGRRSPEARSGMQFVASGQRAYLFGGVSRTKAGGLHIHNDLWELRLDTLHWERLKAKGGVRPPARTSFGLAATQQGLIMYGGVVDEIEGEDGMESEYLSDMWRFVAAQKAWYPVVLRQKPADPVPTARSNGMLSVFGQTMWLWGGLTEFEDREYPLNDAWSFNLSKLVWNREYVGDIPPWLESDSEGDDEAPTSKAKSRKQRIQMTEEEVAAAESDAAMETSQGETLKQYFERTKDMYLASVPVEPGDDAKYVRQQAFLMAQAVYHERFRQDDASDEDVEEMCFYEDLKREDKVATSFQVLGGGSLDVGFTITAPDGKVIYTRPRETEGRYAFIADLQGEYRMCFANTMSTVTEKSIAFSISAGDPPATSFGTDDIDPVSQSILELSEGLSAIVAEQKYARARERTHRNTNESTNDRIKWFSVIELGVLVVMSMWQIIFLRRFVEKGRGGRV